MPMMANADAVEIDGIYYNIISKGEIAEVTSNPNNYSGDLVIPSNITYNGKNYPVKKIGDDSFKNCENLTSLIISDGVTEIGNYVFWFCKSLKSLTIPPSLNKIGNTPFLECNSFSAVYIEDLTSWCQIDFPDGDNPIAYANHLYLNNVEVIDLVIPNDVTLLRNSVFSGCKEFKTVTLPNSITSIGRRAFENCIKLTKINIPNNIKEIPMYMLCGCESITSITIHDGITEIGQWAFEGCSKLETVKIGSNVATIGTFAFRKCPNLKDVYCEAKEVPSTRTDAFEDSYIEYVTLHVPEGCVDAYKAVEPWKNFKDIVEEGGTGINKIKEDIVSEPFDVYDVSGRRVLNCASSLNGLPQGIYIVNGKKILKK